MTNHQHTQQQELAQIITDADVEFFGGAPNPEPTGRALAAAASAIAAGYRKPRVLGYVVVQNDHLLNAGQYTDLSDAQGRADWLNDGQRPGSPIVYRVAEIVEAAS